MSRAEHRFKSRPDKYMNKIDKNYQRFLMAIRGQHIYKDMWAPKKGDRVQCFKDTRSEAKHHDKYPVGVYVKRKSRNVLVGHVPAEISQLMTNFLSYRDTCIQKKNTHKHANRRTHTLTHTYGTENNLH